MKNWNLQGIICFCGLFTWIYRLWLMVQIWWKFRTFTLSPSLPTSVKVNCCCCCIFSRELGWKCRRVHFLLHMGAHRCLDSLPVIRSMHSSLRVLAFMGWAVNLPCAWLELLLLSRASCPWEQTAVQGWEPAQPAASHSGLLQVQAVLAKWTHTAGCVGEKKQFYPKCI